MKRFFAAVLSIIWSCSLAADDAVSTMGVRTFMVADSDRPHWVEDRGRPLLMHMFYPSHAVEEPLYFGADGQDYFLAGRGQWEASLAALSVGEHPLVVMSHGNGGGALSMGWLAEALVERGYIVVGVNHHGNTFVEPYLPQGFVHSWERAQDLRVALDWALQESPFRDHIDHARIASLGFSLGGHTVLALAGAIVDRGYFLEDFCQSAQRDATCEPQSEFPDLAAAYEQVKADPKVVRSRARESDSYLDARVKSAVVVSPPAHLLRPASLANIELPLLILVGDGDETTPADSNAAYLAERIAHADYSEISNARHYSMLSQCTAAGQKAVPRLCTDGDRSRDAIHDEVRKKIVTFLRRTLAESPPDKPPS